MTDEEVREALRLLEPDVDKEREYLDAVMNGEEDWA